MLVYNVCTVNKTHTHTLTHTHVIIKKTVSLRQIYIPRSTWNLKHNYASTYSTIIFCTAEINNQFVEFKEPFKYNLNILMYINRMLIDLIGRKKKKKMLNYYKYIIKIYNHISVCSEHYRFATVKMSTVLFNLGTRNVKFK